SPLVQDFIYLPPGLAATAGVAAAIAVPATAAAEAAFRFGAGFVDGQRAAAHLKLVEFRGRLLRFFVGGHLDEGEPAGAAGGRVAHHAHCFDTTGLAEQLLELCFTRTVGEVSDVKPAS